MRTWLHRHRWSLPTGIAAVVVVLALHLLGAWDAVNEAGYDALVTRFSRATADDRIVLIDIDDVAIDRVGRWPWQRVELARLTQTLHHLGARIIVLDMTFPDAQPPSVDAAEWASRGEAATGAGRDGEAASEAPVRILPSKPVAIDHDAEFAAAIAQAGNVYLGVHAKIEAPADVATEVSRGSRRADTDRRAALRHERMAAELERDFSLQPATLAAALGVPETEGEAGFDAARAEAARRLAARFVGQHPGASWEAFRRSVYGDELDTAGLGDRGELWNAFQQAHAMQAIRERIAAAQTWAPSVLARLTDVRPPVASLAEAAAGVGLVVYQPHQRGIVRSAPLLAVMDDRLVPSLGLAAAADLLELDLATAARRDGGLTLTGASTECVIPVDANGATLIPWISDDSGGGSGFAHLPALRLLEIGEAGRIMERDERWERDLRAASVEVAPSVSNAYERYVTLADERAKLESQAPRGGDIERERNALAAVIAQMADIEAASAARMATFADECGQSPAAQADPFCRNIAALTQLLSEDALARRAAYQRNVAELTRQRCDDLRPLIEGRLCLVGLTATSIGDFITTPAGPMVPGAVAHANIINAILTNQFWRLASPAWNVAAMALLGVLTAVVACVSRPWVGGIVTGTLLVAVPLAAGGGFGRSGAYVAYPSIMIAIGAAWMTVTVAREVTEYRLRRRVVTVLGQYTSPTIAARVADDAGRVGFAPRQARVTCCFVDLRNFTAISEALGPERTRDLLNPYLSGVSERLIQSGAMVNKFLGDGIFAFFDAPILPCPAAARRACEAAAACPDLVARLNPGGGIAGDASDIWYRPSGADPVWHRLPAGEPTQHRSPAGEPTQHRSPTGDPTQHRFPTGDPMQHRSPTGEPPPGGILRVKIGLATGDVAVGDFGTGRKRDYTCIGDAVNVAARLEAANSRLGTTILVDRATRDAAGDGFRWLPLGRLHLPGRAGWVETYAMLSGSADHSGGGDGLDSGVERPAAGAALSDESVQRFTAGVEAFQRGDWTAAVHAFERCLADARRNAPVSGGPDAPSGPPDSATARAEGLRGHLLAAQRYLDAAIAHRQSPPGDFDGALRVE